MYSIILDNRRSVTGIDKIQIRAIRGGRVPPREAVLAAAYIRGRRGIGNGQTVVRALNI